MAHIVMKYHLEKNMGIRVGDTVKWRKENPEDGFFEIPEKLGNFYHNRDTFTISFVDLNDNTCQVVGDDDWCSIFWFEKIEPEYEIGKKYFATNNILSLSDARIYSNPEYHIILAAYLPNAKNPFICVHPDWEDAYEHGHTYETISRRYAKEVPQSRYKAYSSVRHAYCETNGRLVRIGNSSWEVVGWNPLTDKLVLSDIDGICHSYSLDYLFQYTSFINEEPFGELRK